MFFVSNIHFSLADDLSSLEQEISGVRERISRLPKLHLNPLPAGTGTYWMIPQPKEGTDSLWFQLDFGESVNPTSIALAPYYTAEGVHIDFPKHFTITLADREDGAGGHVLHTSKEAPYEFSKGEVPFFRNPVGHSGRYLRVTLHIPSLEPIGGALFRFSEIFVFHNETNLALGASIDSSVEKIEGDRHVVTNLIDSWTPFLPPEDPSVPSFCEGYHSLHNGGQRIPPEPYWIQIDLGESRKLDQINLVPVAPRYFRGVDGYFFPEKFVIEGSNGRDFSEREVLFDCREEGLPNPRNRLLSFHCRDVSARYVRLSVPELHAGLWGSRMYAIAEMEVLSEGLNVSRRRPVKAYRSLDDLHLKWVKQKIAKELSANGVLLDDAELTRRAWVEWDKRVLSGLEPWGAASLTDGLSSHYGLLSLPEWFARLAERVSLEARLARLESLKEGLILHDKKQSELKLAIGLSVAALILLTGGTWYGFQYRKAQRRLRMQLAEDLHDDLSSDLCSITLVSQILESHSDQENVILAQRLKAINQSASRSLDSIRDIILLTQKGRLQPEELAGRLQHTAQNFLDPVGINHRFHCSSDHPRRKALSRKFVREIMLIFKELLTNICKHSKADGVDIRLQFLKKHLELVVRDDGVGLPESFHGHAHQLGMESVRKRVRSLGGNLHIRSGPEIGTCIKIQISL